MTPTADTIDDGPEVGRSLTSLSAWIAVEVSLVVDGRCCSSLA